MKKMHLVLTILALLALPAAAQRFYPDDPLEKEPPPVDTPDANLREVSDLLDMFENIFGKPGDRHTSKGVIPAMDVNTIGEVYDGPWFVDRHAKKRMTPEELMNGPCTGDPPTMKAPWRVLTVNRYNARPGLLIADEENTLYLLRFDPPGRLEMTTGASMVASRAYYALGYWVPENYLVYFDRSQLAASPEGENINAVGKAVKLLDDDIDLFLSDVPMAGDKYRAVATKVPPGKPVGPFQFYGQRSDDPNDIFPHEHRRSLRGLYVVSAWLANNWIRPAATVDFLVSESGVRFIKHYLADFFGSLGSGFQRAKEPREGYEPWFDMGLTLRNFFGFGIRTPRWQKAKYPNIRAVGRLESKVFDPEAWTPNNDFAALANHLPDDDFWAARKVMAFTDEDIRALVRAGGYTDPRAEEWIVRCLTERRDKIGRAYFSKVASLAEFRIVDGELKFTDFGERYGFSAKRGWRIVWAEFNNFARKKTPLPGEEGFRLPEAARSAEDGEYFVATIARGQYGQDVEVYIYKESGAFRVVGAEWFWPGKKILERRSLSRKFRSRYEDLEPPRRKLFDEFTRSYNEKTGFNLTPQEYFESLAVSERTTFDAVTHALMKTQLTDESGAALGSALDLVDSIERIAGQYPGRQGDEQFRLYVLLKPGAREVLDKSREFSLGHENTVYHVGYPHSYRQSGKVPTLQFSVSEDGLRADIDVDYRSSKFPKAMWNGHLSSANSDIRAGDNYKRHNNRWSGLVAWWKDLFGEFKVGEEAGSGSLWPELPPPARVNPLPPNRPLGADIPEIADAALEFHADWLVRRHLDEAMEFISDEALACLALGTGGTVRKPKRESLREALGETYEVLDRATTLSTLIEAVKPWNPDLKLIPHPYDSDFDLFEVSDSLGDSFLCRNRLEKRPQQQTAQRKFGTYYGTTFHLRLPEADEGALALLWKRENGQWRIVSFELLSE